MPRRRRVAWRLVKTKSLSTAFDGESARSAGGRWNSPGVPVVYAAETLSLALVEVLVHLKDAGTLPAYSTVRLDFDEAIVETLPASKLPGRWREYPAPAETRAIGDRWVAEARSVLLRVPSVVVPNESDYVVNPKHPRFARVRRDPPVAFPFDRRLLAR
jgi:RES domain-containing protein